MLRLELEQALKFKPQHLGGRHEERVNEYFLSVQAHAYESPLLEMNVDPIYG
jgi:hypothetical protein